MTSQTKEIIKTSVFTAAACMAVMATLLKYALPEVGLVIPLVLSAVVPASIAAPITRRFLEQKLQIQTLTKKLGDSEGALAHLKRLNEKRSTVDSMTGLFNRQHFLDSTAKFRRMEVSGALIMIDADGMKNINDRFGTKAGDDAIGKLAFAIANALRGGDILGRMGGEEFAVYLSNVTKEQALMVAERIRNNVAAIKFNPDGTCLWALSVSMGVTMDAHVDDIEHMLKRADLALFDAKQGGKNRVSYCRPEASTMVA